MTNPAPPRPQHRTERPPQRDGGRSAGEHSCQGGERNNESFAAPPAKSPELLLRMAIHEAGHAVTRLYLGLGVIESITLDAPEGGNVMWRIERHDDPTEERLTAEMAAILAGRAAEEVVLGNTAAHCGGKPHSDLALATDLAIEMETVLGFGQKWPLLYRPADDRALVLSQDPDLASQVHDRLEAGHNAARAIVARQKDAVEFLAALLLHHRTFDGARLDRILEKVRDRMWE